MGMIAADAATRLARCAAVFEPGEPARTGFVAFHGDLPDGVGAPGELEIAEPQGETVTVPVVRLSVADAVPVLTRARRGSDAHPAAAFWGAAVLVGLQLVARGRIMPGVTENGFDAWRAGPLDPADTERIRELATAMPAAARAIPVPGRTPLELPDAHTLVRGFVDAVADGMPRTAAAPLVAGGPLFAARTPTKAPKLRAWSDELSAGLDAGVRVSLRLEVPGDDYGSGAFHAVVQAHSLADPAVVVDVAQLWADGGLGPSARIEVTLALRRAARVWSPLEPLLSRGVPDRLTLDDVDVTDLFLQAPRLSAAGIDVHWPKELLTSVSAKAVIGQTDLGRGDVSGVPHEHAIEVGECSCGPPETSPSRRPSRAAGGGAVLQPPSNLRSLLGGDGVLSFDWQLALGDQPLTKTELDQLAEAHRPVVRLRAQWVLVDPEIARKARDRELKPVGALEALGVALAGTAEIDGERVEVVSSKWLDDLRARIADPDSGADAVAQPAALTAALRDYQLRGLRWLARMTSLGLGGCLADDMGLGKTITLIALHLHRQSDMDTQGPTLVVCPASLLGNWEREITRFAPGTPVRRYHGNARTLADDGFVLTTYGTMRTDAEQLGAHRWGLLVADEAQHVKNPSSSTAKALRTIPADARVALTGTPVENNLSELWAVLDWTTPGLLGTLGAFRTRWAKPIEADRDEELARRLSKLVRPFLLRRRKSDPGIAPELPPKTETDQPVSLSHEQAALYTAVVRETMESIRQADGMARRGLVMKLITGLKQVCNHPAQYLKEPSAKLTGRSGKLELLDELLDTILAEGGSVLVFTQYVTMARLLERHLRERGIGAALLHGGTSIPRREQLVAEFTAGKFPVFLLSLKAAGTGLNLTRADHVVHYDRWWNPAVEDQATDRAYRIGQTRPVQVHRLIAEGTLEDRIAEMLGTKRDLADSILASGESALTELSDVDLAALVELRGGR